MKMLTEQALAFPDAFARRHVGPGEAEILAMLRALGYGSLEELIDAAVPENIRFRRELHLPAAASEHEVLAELRRIASQNRVFRSFLGMGYHDTITPPVIRRNVLESPGWYTAYTPYQAEIAQGRLEALLNYQTMIIDLTGLPIANASLLDEATAAAEAVAMAHAVKGGRRGDKGERDTFFVSAGTPGSMPEVAAASTPGSDRRPSRVRSMRCTHEPTEIRVLRCQRQYGQCETPFS